MQHQPTELDDLDIDLLQGTGERKEVEISSDALPTSLNVVVASSIVVKKTYHYYENFYRAESLDFFLTRSNCLELALALLTVSMQAGPEINLKFTNPRSELRSLHVPPPRSEIRSLGLQYVGKTFKYTPQKVRPLTSDVRLQDKPVFRLLSDRLRVQPNEWEHRDIVELDSSDVGLLLLVRMLLDLGTIATGPSELELAGLAGGSVGPGSAEARFWLPDSIAWEGEMQ